MSRLRFSFARLCSFERYLNVSPSWSPIFFLFAWAVVVCPLEYTYNNNIMRWEQSTTHNNFYTYNISDNCLVNSFYSDAPPFIFASPCASHATDYYMRANNSWQTSSSQEGTTVDCGQSRTTPFVSPKVASPTCIYSLATNHWQLRVGDNTTRTQQRLDRGEGNRR